MDAGPLVTIAGCGALGSLLASRLVRAGVRVQAYQRAGAQADALRTNGIVVEGEADGPHRCRLEAVSHDPRALAPSELVIVLVKAYDTTALAPLAGVLAPAGVLLTLQNGIGQHEALAGMFGASRLAAGVDTYGAWRIAPGVTGWGGDGFITLGPWHRGLALDAVGELLRGAGLEVSVVPDPRPAIWRKLAINAMVNTCAALSGMRNGQIREQPELMALMRELGREAVAAAARDGVDLDFDDVWAMLTDNLERTAANKASMLQDRESGRPLENDYISGGVLRMASAPGEFPYTRCVHALLAARGAGDAGPGAGERDAV